MQKDIIIIFIISIIMTLTVIYYIIKRMKDRKREEIKKDINKSFDRIEKVNTIKSILKLFVD